MNDAFIQTLYAQHQDCVKCPSKDEVSSFFTKILGTLYPSYSNIEFATEAAFNLHILNLRDELYELLYVQNKQGKFDAHTVTNSFFDHLPDIYRQLNDDVTAMYKGDPAAVSTEEVIRSYPGFYAIAAYRIAHQLAKNGVEILPRMITEHAHSATGIDIHPNAQIGNHFCIDHGTGIVIGETTFIGDHVKIYQGVTLGALSVKKEDAKTKRHPTIGNHVVIYSGATILGGSTEIGEYSVVGGNVWVTKSVPAHSKIYYMNKVITEGDVSYDATIISTEAP